MINEKITAYLEEIMAAMPAGLKQLPSDAKAHIRSAIEAGLHKMDVVSREEFEIQTTLLQRSHAKLDALQAELTALKQRLDTLQSK